MMCNHSTNNFSNKEEFIIETCFKKMHTEEQTVKTRSSPRPDCSKPLDHYSNPAHISTVAVKILSFLTGRPGQTVQTQIRLLLEEQSDQGFHCLLFHLFKVSPLLRFLQL